MSDEVTTEYADDWHLLLLGLAGRIDDAVLVRSRTALAAGQEAQVGSELLAAILGHGVALHEDELELMTELLDSTGLNGADLAQVVRMDGAEPMGFVFTAGRELVDPSDETVDAAAVRAVAGADGALGLWRSWRTPAGQDPGTSSRRVYVIEIAPNAPAIGTTATVQAALQAAGEVDPQVEVYPTGLDLPSYHRFARAYSDLIWTATNDPPVRIAVLFDEVDPVAGPRFSPDHPIADSEELEDLLAYLTAGQALLVTTARLDDVVDPDRGQVVPMTFRTDGAWVWSDASTYYLEVHHLLPDPDLVAHIRQHGYDFPFVDGVGMHRAMAALQEPVEEEPAWTFN